MYVVLCVKYPLILVRF